MSRVKEHYMQMQEAQQEALWLKSEREYEMKQDYIQELADEEASNIFTACYYEIACEFNMSEDDFTTDEIFDMQAGKITIHELAIEKEFILFEDLGLLEMAYVIKEQGKRA